MMNVLQECVTASMFCSGVGSNCRCLGAVDLGGSNFFLGVVLCCELVKCIEICTSLGKNVKYVLMDFCDLDLYFKNVVLHVTIL